MLLAPEVVDATERSRAVCAARLRIGQVTSLRGDIASASDPTTTDERRNVREMCPVGDGTKRVLASGMRTLSQLFAVLSVGLMLGGCSANDATSDDQDNGALFGASSAEEKQAPLHATDIDGYGAVAANREFMFGVKSSGLGGANEKSTVGRVRHGETSAEVLASFSGRVRQAVATDDALFVGVTDSGWKLLRITKGAAPVTLDGPQFVTALAIRGSDLIVGGQKRDRGPEGVLAMPLAGGATRTLVAQADIDRVGGVGKHRVSGASVSDIDVAGSDLVLSIQKTVDGSAQSGIVVAKAPADGGALQVLFDSDDADIVLGTGIVGPDLWIARSLSHGDSESGELVKISLANGSSKRVKSAVGAGVSTGDRFFFGADGFITSIADPATVFVHAHLGFPERLVASPDGKRVYANRNTMTTRLDR